MKNTKTFKNPILSGFYPDPSICRVGEDYYMVTSSFVYFPGLPVFHSRDLVHWEQIGHAIHRPEQLDYKNCETSLGLWAPAIRYHEGTFYVINTFVSEGREARRDNYIVTAKDPAGPWSDPIFIQGADGSVYYTKVNADGQEIRYDASNTYSVSADDYQVLGHNSPDWTMGFQNTLTYKDFDLSIYMYMRWGQMLKYSVLTDYDPTGLNNYPTYFNVWSETNPSNDFPAMDASIKDKLSYYPGFAALSYVDGSFFKIKNITLGYTMPDKLAKKLGLGKLRVYGTITNPFVIAKSHLLKDYDPEMNGGLNYPLTKQLVFGLNLSF